MRYKSTPRILGLVPAKAASSRLTRKNVRVLGGKPLLAWTADAAREAGVFDRLVVSTEDADVATVAEQHGLEAPFTRPQTLAVNPAGVVDVALHALEILATQGAQFDVLVIMLPTCPFRSAQDIVEALGLFLTRDEPNLMSLAAFDHPPFSALGIDEMGIATPFFPESFGRSSQDLPTAFRPNGAIHILDIAWFERSRSYTAGPIVSYVMPRSRSVDIDTEDDLRLAARMLSEQGPAHDVRPS